MIKNKWKRWGYKLPFVYVTAFLRTEEIELVGRSREGSEGAGETDFK